MIRTLLGAAMLTAIVAAVRPAHAAPETRSQAVSVADLDLGDPAGVAALRRRIGSAATAVCGDTVPTDLRALADVRRCRRQAIARANVAVLAAAAQQQQRLAARATAGPKLASR